MVTLVKVLNSEVDKVRRRVVKFLRFGKADYQTSLQVAPYGVDANPIKDMVAIYLETAEKGRTIIIGYINKNQLADIGEHRLFSTDANGVLKTYLWLKNDGTMEIGGGTDHLVRYSKLEEAFNELKDKFNQFATAYVPGSPSTTGLPASVQPSTADITQCKIEEIKTM